MNLAKELASNKEALQINTLPVVSFGKETGTMSFIDETAKALNTGFSIKNDSTEPVFVVFAGFTPTSNRTMFENAAALMAFTGADAVFGKGLILQRDAVGGTTGKVTVESLDSKRDINQLVRYASVSPLRFTKFAMRSKTIAGEKESSNYDNRIKSFWATPLEDTVSKDLDLSPLQVGGNNFNTDMLTVDFQTQGGEFKAAMSNENFFVMKINAQTILNITAGVGAQLSTAQLFYRTIKAADNVMAPVRRQY